MANFINKKSCFIGKNVKIGKNVTIYENNHLEGNTEIEDGVTLLPNNFISNSIIRKNCSIHNSVITDSDVNDNCQIGPFSHISQKSTIGKNCIIGNYVEIKRSVLGESNKVKHFTYVGDAVIGNRCNIGCSVVFVNYDGKEKHMTKVGDHVFIGSNCNLIAPVSIENDSYICAGTIVTESVSKGAFVIGRNRQEEKFGKTDKYWSA